MSFFDSPPTGDPCDRKALGEAEARVKQLEATLSKLESRMDRGFSDLKTGIQQDHQELKKTLEALSVNMSQRVNQHDTRVAVLEERASERHSELQEVKRDTERLRQEVASNTLGLAKVFAISSACAFVIIVLTEAYGPIFKENNNHGMSTPMAKIIVV